MTKNIGFRQRSLCKAKVQSQSYGTTMMRTRHASFVATFIAFVSMMTTSVTEGQLCRCEENAGSLERIPLTSRLTFDEQSGYYMFDGVIVLSYGSKTCLDQPWEGFANIFNNNGGRRSRNLLRQKQPRVRRECKLSRVASLVFDALRHLRCI